MMGYVFMCLSMSFYMNSQDKKENSMNRGQKVYNAKCVSCHMASIGSHKFINFLLG